MRALLYLALLLVLAGLIWWLPMLWEPAIGAAIGGAYWLFFRVPPEQS